MPPLLASWMIKPLKTGAAYPESFDSAYQVWLADERAGMHPFVCDSSVDQCLRHATYGDAK